ncbi:uncharacterized protein [Watersipora subatra]|uniref:uncharacterized protein n=1 Tax=Watersipora subatra TaxID=2589382 RepID=UPI00355C65BE
MRSILDKTSSDFVMPIRLQEPWKFFAIHLPYWDTPRADGKPDGIPKEHALTEMGIMKDGLKHCGFTVLEPPTEYIGSQLDFGIITAWLAEKLEEISSYCGFFFIILSLHGFQGHICDAISHKKIQEFVELINKYLRWTTKGSVD